MQTFKIANKLISNNSKTFIIAEIGLAHMGSLNIAHSFIDAAAKYAVKEVMEQVAIPEMPVPEVPVPELSLPSESTPLLLL